MGTIKHFSGLDYAMVGTTKGGGLLSFDIHSLLSFSLLSICLKIKIFLVLSFKCKCYQVVLG